jgi:hypothetical protein
VEKAKSGILVFNFVVGAILAFILIGLPIGIVGLFVASILDRRNASPDRNSKTLPQPMAPAAEASHGGSNRRPIIYGRHLMVPTVSGERSKLTQTAELQGR